MKYQYGDIKDAKSEDIVEFRGTSNTSFTTGSLYIIDIKDPTANNDRVFKNSGESGTATIHSNTWKLVLTKPGSEAKIGDTAIRFKGGTPSCPTGTVFKVTYITCNNHLGYKPSYSADYAECLILCTEEAIPQPKPRVAIVTASVSGHPIGSRVVPVDKHEKKWILESNPNSTIFSHGIDNSLTWEDEMTPQRKYKVGDQLRTSFSYTFTSDPIVTITKITNTHYHTKNSSGETGKDSFDAIENGPYYHNDVIPQSPTFTIDPAKPNADTSAHTPTPQGGIMPKESTNIEIKVDGQSINLCQNNAAEITPKTDLEAKLPFAMVVYGVDGSYDTIKYNKSLKGVKKRKSAYLQRPENLGKTVTLHQVIGEYTTTIPVVKVK